MSVVTGLIDICIMCYVGNRPALSSLHPTTQKGGCDGCEKSAQKWNGSLRRYMLTISIVKW